LFLNSSYQDQPIRFESLKESSSEKNYLIGCVGPLYWSFVGSELSP
jgi:hypothetical protein